MLQRGADTVQVTVSGCGACQQAGPAALEARIPYCCQASGHRWPQAGTKLVQQLGPRLHNRRQDQQQQRRAVWVGGGQLRLLGRIPRFCCWRQTPLATAASCCRAAACRRLIQQPHQQRHAVRCSKHRRCIAWVQVCRLEQAVSCRKRCVWVRCARQLQQQVQGGDDLERLGWACCGEELGGGGRAGVNFSTPLCAAWIAA